MIDVSQSAPVAADEGWHAQFSPSSSERWLACPASLVASKDMPPAPASRFAAEGTAAHTLASRCFEYCRTADFWIGEQIEVEGFVFTVDEEMARHVQSYVDDALSRVLPGDTAMFEQRVYFAEAIGVEGQGGTSDYIILRADRSSLVVEDLKYGMGVAVSAFENTQMMTYAVGVLETFDAIMEDVQEVTLVIHQPRIDNISEWTCTRADLEKHVERMRLAASAVKAAEIELEINGKIPERYFGVSEKGCRWCPVKPTCDAYRQFVSRQVFDDFEVLDNPDILEVTGKPAVPSAASKLGSLFGHLDIIEEWCRGVRAEVERLVLAGTEVIGPDGKPMKVIEGKKGNRAWKDEDQAKAALVGRWGPEKAYKPAELITPAAAEKLYGKKGKAEFADAIAPLVTQAPGKPKVTLGSDPAPPYHPEASADEFEDLGAVE